MLVASTLDDVMLTKAFTGLDASMLRPSIEAAGLDPVKLDEQVSMERAKQRRWRWLGRTGAAEAVGGHMERRAFGVGCRWHRRHGCVWSLAWSESMRLSALGSEG